MPNYVKFQRGSISAYEKQKELNRIDPNTLYFVYDNPDEGLLYLGERLISGIGSGTSSGVTTLAGLNDVLINGELVNKSFLFYEPTQSKWVPKSLEAITNLIISEINFDTNIFTNVDGTISLKGFNTAPNNSYLTVVDGSLSWKEEDTSIIDRVTNLETVYQNIDTKISTEVSKLNHLTYEVVESGKTLQEIELKPNIIYLIKAKEEGEDLYKEYMLVNGKAEFLGNHTGNIENLEEIQTAISNLETSVSGIQTSISNLSTQVETIDNKIGDLNDIINYESDEKPTTVVQQLNILNARLTWQDIVTE